MSKKRNKKKAKRRPQNYIQKVRGATPQEQGTYLISEDGVTKLHSDPETHESLDDILDREWIAGVIERMGERLHLAVDTYHDLDLNDGFPLYHCVQYGEHKDGAGKMLLTLKGIPFDIWQAVWENRNGLFDPETFANDLCEATNDAIAEVQCRAYGKSFVVLEHDIEVWFVQGETPVEVGGLQIEVTHLPPLETWLFKAEVAA